MLRLLSYIVLLQVTLSLCPPSCNCTSPTQECVQCLWQFNRYYNSNEDDCICYSGYIEKVPPSDSCRAVNCKLYGDLGCITCRSYMIIYQYAGLNQCKCIDPLYGLSALNACVCSANNSPTLYFQDKFTGQCFVCPSYCTCNQTGCVYCQGLSKRVIKDMGTFKTCPCQRNYYDNGIFCSLYHNCEVANGGSITCGDSSHRTNNSVGLWICKYPYVDIEGSCVCTGNYVTPSRSDFYVVEKCICPSKQLSTSYYEYNSQCLRCPTNCTCNTKGCTSCQVDTNRQLVGGSCPCKWPYIEQNGNCICTEPFFKRLYMSNGETLEQCVCLSEYEQSIYFYVPAASICQQCPQNCICNYQGCYSCQTFTLRKVVQLTVNNNSYSTCNQCVGGAIYLNDICVCSPLAEFNSTSGRCECVDSPQIYSTHDGDCKVCPTGCTCEALGCTSCDFSTSRTIYYQDLYSDCPCQQNWTQINRTCHCVLPFVSLFGACSCQHPYTMRETNCVCMSELENENYYIDLDGMCSACPNGCKCNASGCVECHPDTMRTVYRIGRSVCPCLQNAELVGNTCTICPMNQMVSAGRCVECPNCLACDLLGCVSCHNQTVLQNHDCVCSQPDEINVRGVCICQTSKFRNHSTGNCEPCPYNCLTCALDSQNILKCTSCRRNSNRLNSPEDGCPCLTGFKQNLPGTEYCCQLKCSTCDEAGCTSCNQLMNRQLVNRSCPCKSTFTETTDGLCSCSSGYVLFTGICVECPINCKECDFNITTGYPYCTSCHPNTHRVMNSSSCQCEPGYTQFYIIEQFCIPNFCQTYSNGKCVKCLGNRRLTEGMCLCPANFYDADESDCVDCKTIPGCIECSSGKCDKCDEQHDYYLAAEYNNRTKETSVACFKAINKTQAVLAQAAQITLQFVLPLNLQSYTVVKQARVTITRVFPNASFTSVPVENLQVVNISRIDSDILRLTLSNPSKKIKNALFLIRLTTINYTVSDVINGSDENGSYQGLNQVAYVYKETVYSQTDMQYSQQFMFSSVITGILLFVSAVLYVMSYKHNSIVFLMQIMSLIAYVKHDRDLLVVPLLHCIRYSYYNFMTVNRLVPQGYILGEFGNFNHLQRDSSLLNVVPFAMGIALINGILICIMRVLFYFMRSKIERNYGQKSVLHSIKRYLYRAAEFLYKTTMFPLLFCSIIGIYNWNGQDMTSSLLYGVIVRVLSILILLIYTVVTVWQCTWENISIFWKIENLNQFLSSLFCSLILSLTVFKKEYLIVLLVILLKGSVSVVSKKYLLRDFTRYEYGRAVIALFSIMAVASVELNNSLAALALMLLAISLDIVLQVLVIIKTTKNAITQRSKEAVTEQATSSMDKIQFVRQTKVAIDELA